MTLQQTQPGARRRFFGRFLVASLIVGAGYAGLAARANDAPVGKFYEVRLSTKQLLADEVTLTADRIGQGTDGKLLRIIARPGEKFSIAQGNDFRAEFVITPVSAADRTYKLAAEVTSAGEKLRPTIIGRLGEKVGLSLGGNGKRLDIGLVVNETAGMPNHGE